MRELVEIPGIPNRLTFKQFNQYVNPFESISTYESQKNL